MHNNTTHHSFFLFLQILISSLHSFLLKTYFLSRCDPAIWASAEMERICVQKRSTLLAQHAKGAWGGKGRRQFWKGLSSHCVYVEKHFVKCGKLRDMLLNNVFQTGQWLGRVGGGREHGKRSGRMSALALKRWCFVFEIQNNLVSVAEEEEIKYKWMKLLNATCSIFFF